MTQGKTAGDGTEKFWQDAAGRLVPESLMKQIDMARDAIVRELIDGAKNLSTNMAYFKGHAVGDLRAFLELSAEKYGVTPRGMKGKGNITFYSFDGAYKIQIAISERMVFDERLQAAKALIDECINEWSQGSDDKIRMLVQLAFQTDQEGRIDTGRVLELRRLEIDDPKWQQAMAAISDSLQVVGSKQYIRFYERIGASGDQYRAIVLDVAAV